MNCFVEIRLAFRLSSCSKPCFKIVIKTVFKTVLQTVFKAVFKTVSRPCSKPCSKTEIKNEGYYKLRKAELIHKLEALPELNEEVLIPGLEIPRNTTRSVNTSAILDQPTQDDNTVLKRTQKFIAESKQEIKHCWNWLFDYIPPKPKVIDEAFESFKNLIKKKYNERDTSFQLK